MIQCDRIELEKIAKLTGSFRVVVAIKSAQVDGQNGPGSSDADHKGEADRQVGAQCANHSRWS